MDEILKYENRESLYKFLIDDFGLKKVEERHFPDSFGNFFVVLTTKDFSLRYSNEKSVISIEIASNYENNDDKWYALSCIRDLIYSPDKINVTNPEVDNLTRIEKLNDFLRRDFNRINELFSKKNYSYTKKKLDEELKKQFYLRFPSAKP